MLKILTLIYAMANSEVIKASFLCVTLKACAGRISLNNFLLHT